MTPCMPDSIPEKKEASNYSYRPTKCDLDLNTTNDSLPDSIPEEKEASNCLRLPGRTTENYPKKPLNFSTVWSLLY